MSIPCCLVEELWFTGVDNDNIKQFEPIFTNHVLHTSITTTHTQG